MGKKVFKDSSEERNQLKYDITWQGMSVTDAARKHHMTPATVRKKIEEGGWVKLAKVCTKCGKIRNLGAYSKDAKARDGRRSACRACRSPLGELAIELAFARDQTIQHMRRKEAAAQLKYDIENGELEDAMGD